MNVEKELYEIVKKVLENYPGVFLVKTSTKQQLHEIVIDGDELLGIYDISEISRTINQMADEKMPEEQYSLEIASPGADSDLIVLRQYPKHVGRNFNVVLKDERKFSGKLISVSAELLEFEPLETKKPKNAEKLGIQKVNYTDIKKANIILSFK